MSFSDRWAIGMLADGEWVRRDFGPLRIVLLNRFEEWRIAKLENGRELPESGTADDLPDDLEWERWDHDPKDTRFHFRPAFPGMPVVARPNNVLNLSPKGEATFFVGIPAWIEIVAECQGEMLLLKGEPTEELSKTWRGSPLAGRLGYALRTYARRAFVPEEWPPMEILCAISIVNEGKATLPFERLYLETDHLSVFENDGRLWSNAARIRAASAESSLSNIVYASRPMAPYENAEEVTAPRKGKVRKSTIQSTFAKVLGHFNPLEVFS